MTENRPAVETGRLRLEPLSALHLTDYAALIARPDVHRYLSRAAEIAADPGGQAARIVAMSEDQWTRRGYGPFAIFEKSGTDLIGRGGLFWIEALQDVEINYMFHPAVWSQGYATEVAATFLEIGFAEHGLQRMVATTHPQNTASARVLHKVGMRPCGSKDLGGDRVAVLHAIRREQWESRGRRAVSLG